VRKCQQTQKVFWCFSYQQLKGIKTRKVAIAATSIRTGGAPNSSLLDLLQWTAG